MKVSWRTYANLVNIPEGKSGKVEVQHNYTEPGATLMTANLRTMMMGGDESESITFPERVRWHKLYEEEQGVWMTDLPIEQRQMRQSIRGFQGDILVGGLGLGVIVQMLVKRKNIGRIVVVEDSADVISLVKPYLPRTKRIEVIDADLFEYLKDAKKRKETYRNALYDIWQSDGEGTFFEVVVPLRNLSEGIVWDRNLVCWNENVMRGQLYHSLQTRIILPTMGAAITRGMTHEYMANPDEDERIYFTWTAPFFKTALKFKWSEEEMQRRAPLYVNIYGHNYWEKQWQNFEELYKATGGNI